MLYSQEGEILWYDGLSYTVGAQVYANESSEYSGLFGKIMEIRTGNDRETENDTPDIYCAFDPPVLSVARKELETVFSDLYHSPKSIEELGLDFVIMGPDMLTPLPTPDLDYPQATLYVVASHWANDGEYGSYEIPFTDQLDAKRQFHNDLRNEQEDGCIERWRTKSNFAEEETESGYECYLDGEYCESHFSIQLKKVSLPLGSCFLNTVASICSVQELKENFLEQVQDWKEFQSLTAEQQEKLLTSANIPQQILLQLRNSRPYHEAYREAVSKAAASILAEFRQQLDSSSQK